MCVCVCTCPICNPFTSFRTSICLKQKSNTNKNIHLLILCHLYLDYSCSIYSFLCLAWIFFNIPLTPPLVVVVDHGVSGWLTAVSQFAFCLHYFTFVFQFRFVLKCRSRVFLLLLLCFSLPFNCFDCYTAL